MAKYQFDDEYQVSIRYTCRYKLIESEEYGRSVSIECVFKEFSPMMRMEVHTDPGYFGDLTKEEDSIYSPFADWFVFKGVNLIVEDAYKAGRNPRTTTIRQKFGENLEENPINYPVILGFTGSFNTKPDDSDEMIHQKVKEWTKDISALLLHSPMFNVAMVKDPFKDWPSRPRDYLEFSKTKPERFVQGKSSDVEREREGERERKRI